MRGQEYGTRTISTDIREIVKQVGANIQVREDYRPSRTKEEVMETLHFSHAESTKMLAKPESSGGQTSKKTEDRTKNSVACMASGKNLHYQIPKNETGK